MLLQRSLPAFCDRQNKSTSGFTTPRRAYTLRLNAPSVDMPLLLRHQKPQPLVYQADQRARVTVGALCCSFLPLTSDLSPSIFPDLLVAMKISQRGGRTCSAADFTVVPATSFLISNTFRRHFGVLRCQIQMYLKVPHNLFLKNLTLSLGNHSINFLSCNLVCCMFNV